MIMKTICLKLHDPSRAKRIIIEEAMASYTEAFNHLLKEAAGESDDVWTKYLDVLGRYRGVKVSKWVDSRRSSELNRFNCEPFKDSLKMDFGATFSGFLNLRRINREAGYPGVSNEPDKDETLRPILFCRYSEIRDYCLLYDKDNDKFYVKMYMLNSKSELKRAVNASKDKKLYYISKDGKAVRNSTRKERFIIVPLSFGKWQEEYLKAGIENPDIFKTARLIKKGNNFYLYINLKLETPALIRPLTYLGVCRSLKNQAYLTLTDMEGNFIKSSPVNLYENKKEAASVPLDIRLHIIANYIIKNARRNKSQIVVENLSDKGDMLHWKGKDGREYSPYLSASNFRKLSSLLKYKAEASGLPAPIQVSPVGVFYTCPQCGLNNKNNRLSYNMFLCTACGKAGTLDELGSLNVARRVIKYNNDTIKIEAQPGNGEILFKHDILDFSCILKNDADIMKNLEAELISLTKAYENEEKYLADDRENNKKYSMIKKLINRPNILDSIQIIFTDKDSA